MWKGAKMHTSPTHLVVTELDLNRSKVVIFYGDRHSRHVVVRGIPTADPQTRASRHQRRRTYPQNTTTTGRWMWT